MKVVVLGSGVVGTAAAWYLAEAGHEVVVVERQAGAGLETSFGNAGEISPGASASWAAPGIPLQALKWQFMRHRPLVIRPRPDPALIRWCLTMLRNCTAARYELNKARMLPLAEYSRDVLRALRVAIGITYDERASGILQLYRSPKELEATAGEVALLQRFGVAFEVLDRAGCIRAEPALAQVREKIAGGLRLPDDETGDCFKFTQALAAAGRQRGIEFRYDTNVARIALAGERVSGIVTDRGTVSGDAELGNDVLVGRLGVPDRDVDVVDGRVAIVPDDQHKVLRVDETSAHDRHSTRLAFQWHDVADDEQEAVIRDRRRRPRDP